MEIFTYLQMSKLEKLHILDLFINSIYPKRKGKAMTEIKKESTALKFLYHTALGRILLKILSSRWVSRLCAAFLDSRFSKPLIGHFIRKNHIKTTEYICNNFRCFNDCFSRKIKQGLRPIDQSVKSLISPCDGLLSAYQITDKTVLPVKQSCYTIDSLLKNKKLSSRYQNGICLVLRLCVNHYHRYCYIDNGRKGKNIFIPGKLHTVRPIALESVPVFTQNCREYTVMQTENFGRVTQVEVGAMLVGKIKNHHGSTAFFKGQEKGMFLYGGSTIILLFEKDKIKIPESIFVMTGRREELAVKMGEKIGESVS